MFWDDDTEEEERDEEDLVVVNLEMVLVEGDILLEKREDDVSLIDFNIGVLLNEYGMVVLLELLINVLLVGISCVIGE